MTTLDKIREANITRKQRLFYDHSERNASNTFPPEDMLELVKEGYLKKICQVVCDEMNRDYQNYKNSGRYVEAFLEGYKYFIVHLDAGIERVKRNEPFNPTTPLT